MNKLPDYIAINKQTWNKKADIHLDSEFYDVHGFLAGKSSLQSIELKLLGDLNHKKVLHLQCHFGQDTLSLARLGAQVTGVDFSDKAIEHAQTLAKKLNIDATFICCDLYDTPAQLDEKFDVVFTSYGTIGWLPDLTKWAEVVAHFLKPDGLFVMADFHPVVWMYDNDFKHVFYSYFNVEPIYETENGTYAEREAPIETQTISWNHSISELLNALIKSGIEINTFNEYNYSPYNCFNETEEFEQGKFRIKAFENKIPMVYAIVGNKK